MSLRVFNIGAGGDDQSAQATSNGVYASQVYNSHSTSGVGGTVFAARSFSGNFFTHVGLLRFDTSALPTDANISSAKLRLVPYAIANTDTRSVVGEYFDWDGDSGDWTNTAPASPIFSKTISTLSVGAPADFDLSSTSGISNSGVTEFRFHISGGQPTGLNNVEFADSTNPTYPGPCLIVEYTSATEQAANGGAQVAVIPVAGPLDDQRIRTSQASYPPGGISRTTTESSFVASRSFNSPNYSIQNGLLRFDTSLLPDNAAVSSAALKVHTMDAINTNALSLTGGWYAWDGSSSSDYAAAPETDAISGVAVSSFTSGTVATLSLSNVATNVSKTGLSRLRLHVSERPSNAAPTGFNYLEFASYEHATNPAPELIVYYTTQTNLRVFNIGAGTDDAVVNGFHASSYASVAYDTGSSVDTFITLQRTKSGSAFYTSNGLVRFDTSVLPDDAVVISAKLRLYIGGKSSADSRSVVADWYNWSSSYDSTDFSATAQNGAHAGTTIASITTSADLDLTLTNFAANVSPTGYSYLRLHIDGVQPTGTNFISYHTSTDTTFPGPRLIVEYTSATEQAANGGAQVAVIPVAGPLDDGTVFGNGSPYASQTYGSHALGASTFDIWPRRSWLSGSSIYQTQLGLLRFDTTLLPDAAIISAATLTGYAFGAANNSDTRNLVGDYRAWDGTSSDWTLTAPASPIFTKALSTITAAGVIQLPLTSTSGISPAIATGIRLHISGGQPAGLNQVTFAEYEDTANPAPELIVYYTTGDDPIASFTYTANGLAFSFTDTSVDPDGTIASRSWNFGDSTTSTSANPSKTYATSGSYTVTLTVTDNTGATATVSQTVVANALPTANYTTSGSGLSRAFTDTSTDPNGTIASRAWDFGDGTTSTSTNPSKTWASAGTYTVTLTVTDNQGATDSEQKFITVAPPGAGKSYLSGYVFKRTVELLGNVTASQDTIPVEELAYWPSEGEGMVDQEIFSWADKSGINGPGNLTGVTRGLYSTVPVSHLSGVILGLLGRHDGGISTQRIIPLMPANASIGLQELRNHQGDRFCWADFNNFKETAQLDITGAPTAPGNVSTTLDENGVAVTRSSVVAGAAETISLVINNPQTTAGDITVTLNGVAKTIALPGGIKEQVQWILSGTATGAGGGDVWFYNATNVLTQTNNYIAENSGESASTIAARIRAASFSGWVMSGSGSTVIATASSIGVRGISPGEYGWRYDPDAPGITDSAALLQEGSANLTAAEVATAIRNTSFPGWTTGGTGATVTFTYNTPGNLTGTHQYNPGTTGASSTVGMQVTNGSETTADGVAAAIRATYAANTYWTVSGTGSRVTWVSIPSGPKTDATFNPQDTGTEGTMQTVEQGSADVVAHIKDSFGEEQRWRVLANIATTTKFNIETAVTGAGTARGIVSVWGSFGTNLKKLIRRWTDVNLTDHALGQIAYGVTEESSTGLTWDVHTDEVEIYALGGSETYYRDHNALGQLVRKAVGYFRNEPEQAMQDVYVQEHRQPVIPGQQITVGAFLEWEDVPDTLPAKPLYVSLHHADGTETGLGALTETGLGSGQTGTQDWTEVYGTFTIPTEENPDKQAYEFRIHSRDISRGTIYFQELAYSIGDEAKRTYLYSPEGVFIVTHDTRTPREVPYAKFGRKRIALENQYEAPPGTSVSTEYQATDDPDVYGPTWQTDPSLVEDYEADHVRVTMDGDGLVTPEVLPGYPRVANRLLVGRSPDQPILLKPDGTEFDGGVWFVKYEDWHFDEEPIASKLMSGRSVTQGMHGPVGFIPKLQLGAVRPETIQRLKWMWHKELYVAEAYDKSFTIRLLAKPDFSRKIPPHRDSRGWQRGQWETSDISAEIIEIRDVSQ